MTGKIFLTGAPGVGKTTVLKSIVQELKRRGIQVGGMFTEEVRESGIRVGFKIVDVLAGTESWLASTRQGVGPRIGRYVVDLSGLEGIGVKAITDALGNPEVKILVIDELGPMELLSSKFKMAIKDAIESTKSMIGTIHSRTDDPLLHEIRSARDIRIVTVTTKNRASLPTQIVEEIGN